MGKLLSWRGKSTLQTTALSQRNTPQKHLFGMSSMLYPPLFSEIPFINIFVFFHNFIASTALSNKLQRDKLRWQFFILDSHVLLLIIYPLSSLLEQFYDFIVRSKINCEIIYSIGVWHDATCILVCTSFRLQWLAWWEKEGIKTHASKLQFCADETSKSCTNFENGITMSFCMASARAKECTLHND